jgi:hypothetical protein
MSGKEIFMPACNDCALYPKKIAIDEECTVNGPVPPTGMPGGALPGRFGHGGDVFARFEDPGAPEA